MTEPEWIPVWEKVPAYEGRYFVLTIFKDGTANPDVASFSTDDGWYISGHEGARVAAWLPIPPYEPRCVHGDAS